MARRAGAVMEAPHDVMQVGEAGHLHNMAKFEQYCKAGN
jgi:hypothetical protein